MRNCNVRIEQFIRTARIRNSIHNGTAKISCCSRTSPIWRHSSMWSKLFIWRFLIIFCNRMLFIWNFLMDLMILYWSRRCKDLLRVNCFLLEHCTFRIRWYFSFTNCPLVPFLNRCSWLFWIINYLELYALHGSLIKLFHFYFLLRWCHRKLMAHDCRCCICSCR
jgi:hypothetical protein